MSGYWSNNPEKYDEVERNAVVRWLVGVIAGMDPIGYIEVDDVHTLPVMVEALQVGQPEVFRAIINKVPLLMIHDAEMEHFEAMAP